MKFGNSLVNQITPEWSSHYINYNKLKTTLKYDSIQFHPTLKEEIQRAQLFYIKKLKTLKDNQFNSSTYGTNRKDLIKLFQFAQLNMQSIRKITKKYDKHNVPFNWNFEEIGIFDWQEDITFFGENDLLEIVKPSPIKEIVLLGNYKEYEEYFINNKNLINLDTSNFHDDEDPKKLSGSLKLHSILLLKEICLLNNCSLIELEKEFGKSFLSTAIGGGHWFDERSIEFFSFLLEMGIAISKNLLHLILENKNEYLLLKLFPLLEDQIDEMDDYGNLPLCYALKSQSANLLKIFIKKFSKLKEFSFKITKGEGNENDALVLCCRLYNSVDPDCDFLKSLLVDGNYSPNPLYSISLCVQHSWKKELTLLLMEGHSLDFTDPNTGIDLLTLSANIGDLEVIGILLNAGANPTIIDDNDWVPHEHAFLKGHLHAGMVLKHSFNEIHLKRPEIAYKRINNNTNNNVFLRERTEQAQKEREIIGLYGLLRIRIVDLFLKKMYHKKLFISTIEKTISLDLPLLPNYIDNLYSLPINESINSNSDAVLKIEIHSSIKKGMSSLFLNSLIKDSSTSNHLHHLPIIGDDYEMIGNITLEILPVLPLPTHHLSPLKEEEDKEDREIFQNSKIIGHRGLGSNRRKSTEKIAPSSIIRENTLLSFLMAIKKGADYIEFDVQLTKDRHPIIYHDFTIHELKNIVEVPVHALSLKEFLNLNLLNEALLISTQNHHITSSFSLESSNVASNISNTNNNLSKKNHYYHQKTLLQRHHKTIEGLNLEESRNSSFKNNATNDFIMAPGLSLREVFKGIPSGVGFNIEIKYPVKDEVLGHCFEVLKPLEINGFVDDIISVCLEEAYFNGGGVSGVSGDGINPLTNNTKIKRPLMFSSFNPDICYLLSLKQRKIPVFFLTDGGMTRWVKEERGNSIDSAVKFSIRANLAGIVCNSTPLIEAPNLIGYIKRSGLSLFTYGPQNNDIEGVKLQKANGVDAIIVDDVGAIYKGLNI